ncbi:amino acid ABC transporter substrate-binding protein, PAAT family (TC 3.A.1.3.-) [Desulfacinum hydrothermale DSM 13146]|uniref:Amino acid ABC transporter substrate-binding protein, PAAT family (TC 3.A.1.3.-) n=1 Tax=Desulfacinum hydrothermale DSM 13146 TaxID=1121390 RepID=A0A1W1XT51_9BACT|nr:transporter substrate-binding domain-containing protein [Desulfacinum hydrothermale]SMC27044.1 amino acid ABC transporter substrate-binding protein, PAAT family (TC 3.A.1.3.-) [Desulfacinum hydrothermale DSM 13146]
MKMGRCMALMLLALVLACLPAWGEAQALTTHDIFRASTLNQVLQRNKLIVGMEVEYFPFEYADEKGQPIGFDVDMARLIAKELGVELEIKDIEWTGLIPSLQSGKVDLVISGMTRTLARARAVSFTDPYFVTGLCALLSVKRASDVNRVDQLNAPGRVLAVKTGTTGDLVASKRFPKATINRFKDETACVREVVTGRADAFFYDQISIAKHHKQNPNSTIALLKPFTYEPFAIAIRKGDADFLQWLNLFLETIKADGRYDEIFQKHLGDILKK